MDKAAKDKWLQEQRAKLPPVPDKKSKASKPTEPKLDWITGALDMVDRAIVKCREEPEKYGDQLKRLKRKKKWLESFCEETWHSPTYSEDFYSIEIGEGSVWFWDSLKYDPDDYLRHIRHDLIDEEYMALRGQVLGGGSETQFDIILQAYVSWIVLFIKERGPNALETTD